MPIAILAATRVPGCYHVLATCLRALLVTIKGVAAGMRKFGLSAGHRRSEDQETPFDLMAFRVR
jgi:hypothetical protein